MTFNSDPQSTSGESQPSFEPQPYDPEQVKQSPYGTGQSAIEPAPQPNDYQQSAYGQAPGQVAPYSGPQSNGPQYGAPQYSGPQYNGPQYGGTPYSVSQYGAPQYAPNPYPTQNVENSTNIPGLWSLILALSTWVIAFIPILGVFAFLTPFAGIVTGIIGLAMEKYRGKRALAGWGLGLNIATIIVVPLLIILFVASVIPFAILQSETSY
ncbi:MAG: hypothetical protein ACTHXA_05390 [Gulosibacter sp.]|uniref:hypothetical protein n=1 Tax=Gulosibacter sp. TaxID=2817531 RepID=UPI003F915F1E